MALPANGKDFPGRFGPFLPGKRPRVVPRLWGKLNSWTLSDFHRRRGPSLLRSSSQSPGVKEKEAPGQRPGPEDPRTLSRIGDQGEPPRHPESPRDRGAGRRGKTTLLSRPPKLQSFGLWNHAALVIPDSELQSLSPTILVALVILSGVRLGSSTARGRPAAVERGPRAGSGRWRS